MNANILMVDDSRTIRFQVRKILEAEPDHDYKISEAGDGKEALDFVAHVPRNICQIWYF